MAISITSRLGLKRWSADTDPFEREDFDANMAALEAQVVRFTFGTRDARPAPSKPGTMYLVADAETGRPTFFWDTGSAWVELRPDLTGYVTTGQLGSAVGDKASIGYVDNAVSVKLSIADSRVPLDVALVGTSFIVGSGAGEYGGTTISGSKLVDGVNTGTGNTVLLVGQPEVADAPANGVYITSSSGAWTKVGLTGGQGRFVRITGATRRGQMWVGEVLGTYERWGRILSGANGDQVGTAPLLQVRSDPAGYHPKVDVTLQGFVGQIVYWPGSVIPQGWGLANGAFLSRITYPTLYVAVGQHRHNGGTDPGNNQFKLPTVPDLSGGLVRAIICLGAA